MNSIPSSSIHKYAVLGLLVSAIDMQDALNAIQGWIDHGEPHYVCCVPAHAVMEAYDHPELRNVYAESGLNTPDGMAIVWLLRRAGYKQVERVYGPDLLLTACEYGQERGWKHYFYGSTPEAVEKLVVNLKKRFPDLQVAGFESPPFRILSSSEDKEATERINAANPDILWVSLGSPKQEQWMHSHTGQIKSPVMVGVGAAFDFLSGTKPQAPRWMQRTGLEWFYRLTSEPKRLWKRYILGYPRFVWLILMQSLGLLKLPKKEF